MLELLLEEQLAQAFPLDTVAEVKKGVRGGDAVHTVMSRSGQPAGVILWEAKRSQKRGPAWPANLKDDMRAAGAEAGVIVTTSFPPEWPEGQPFGLHEDVWVTSAAAAIPLAAALRAGLLEAFRARVASANKGEKMEAVYDYLTSTQFAQKLRAVYDAFRKMRALPHVRRRAARADPSGRALARRTLPRAQSAHGRAPPRSGRGRALVRRRRADRRGSPG